MLKPDRLPLSFSPRITLDIQNLTDEAQRQTFECDNATYTYDEPGTNILLGIRGRL